MTTALPPDKAGSGREAADKTPPSSLTSDQPTGQMTSVDDPGSEGAIDLLVLAEEGGEAPDAGAAQADVQTPQKSRRLAILLMMGAVFSKILGFGREILMAHLFGVGIVADAFRAAVTGVFAPMVLLQNESVPTIIIPMYRDLQESGLAARKFAALALALTGLSAAIIGLVILFSAQWVTLFVGGFSAEAKEMTSQFIAIMGLAMPASVLINVLAAGEIALGRSRLTTARASFLNIAVISGLLAYMATGWIMALAVSVTLAFNSLALWGLFMLVREGALDFRSMRLADISTALQEFWMRLRPMFATPLVEQANVWVERVLASQLNTGTVASLDYARTITDSAILFISQPVGLVLLSKPPSDNEAMRMEALSRPVLACAIPASICLGIFGPDVARAVFSRGAFNDEAVLLTGQALRGISLGLWAMTLGWILLRLLNSAGRNKIASRIILAAYAVSTLANLLFYALPYAKNFGPFAPGVSESLRAFVLLGATAVALQCGRRLLVMIGRTIPACLVMLGSGLLIQTHIDNFFAKAGLASAACLGSIAIGLALLDPGILRYGAKKILSFFNLKK